LIQGNYIKGLEYLFKSLKIAQEINDLPGIAYQYNNIAGVYYESYRDFEKALQYYYKALAVNRKLGNKYQEGTNLLNIGLTHFEMKQMDSALFYAQNALTIFNILNAPFKIAGCQILLGEYYTSVNNFDKGLEFALSALEIGQKQSSIETIHNAAAVLHKLFLKKNDFKNAYKYSTIEDQAKDSLYFQQNQKDLLKLEFLYNSDKIEKERQIKQQQKNYIIGFIILSLVSGIIIVVLINSRQRLKVNKTLLEKEAVENELDFKNKELAINLMALTKKNDLTAELLKSLISFEKMIKDDELKIKLATIIRNLKNKSEDKFYEEFSLRFSQINSDFYTKILEKYPDLTSNELKLCAFLRLNMTTKEISDLTGQQTLTIENARYRLRKKLGIGSSETNLVSFLNQV
jgi:tetratricopeptide (TPR) repeat protein